MPRNIKKILQELKKGLVEIYGDQLKTVVLFGSYARGDAHPPDSDIDVMIVLNGDVDYVDAEKRSSEFISSLCLKHDVLISWVFASNKNYMENQMPFMLNVRAEGIAV